MNLKTQIRALRAVPYGLYVVGSNTGGIVSTIVANWLTQVSFDPLQIAIAIEKDSTMRQQIEQSSVFSVNMLPAGGKDVAKSFLKASVPAGGAINGREYTLSKGGTPFLNDAHISIECTVVQTIPTGDHLLFIAEVTDAVVRQEGDTLTLKETGWRYSR